MQRDSTGNNAASIDGSRDSTQCEQLLLCRKLSQGYVPVQAILDSSKRTHATALRLENVLIQIRGGDNSQLLLDACIESLAPTISRIILYSKK